MEKYAVLGFAAMTDILDVITAGWQLFEAGSISVAYQYLTTVDFEQYPLAVQAVIPGHIASRFLTGVDVHNNVHYRSSSKDWRMALLRSCLNSLVMNDWLDESCKGVLVTSPASVASVSCPMTSAMV